MKTGNQQPSRALASQNGAIEVKEYIAPYGDHGGHRRLLSLIDGQWVTEAAWQKLAKEKLNMCRHTFYSTKKELEHIGCVEEFAGHYAAILIQIPVPDFNRAEEMKMRATPLALVHEELPASRK